MHIQMYTDKQNQWRWRAIDTNGRIIADGAEGYATQGNVLRALLNVVNEFKSVTTVHNATDDRIIALNTLGEKDNENR